VRTFLQGLTLPAPSVWPIYGNGDGTPDKVDFEMHPCCHWRRPHASAARPVFKSYNADLRETL
jgi:hypothetical protein